MANNRLMNVGTWIGSGITSFNESSLQEPGQLGQIFEKDGVMYQLVQLDSSAVTAAAGHAVTWLDYDDFIVTNDISDNSGGGANAPAGVLLGVITAGYYCFIQVRGPYSAVVTNGDDDIAAGDVIWVSASADGQVDSTAAGTAPVRIPLGVATAADVDASNTVAAYLFPPLNY